MKTLTLTLSHPMGEGTASDAFGQSKVRCVEHAHLYEPVRTPYNNEDVAQTEYFCDRRRPRSASGKVVFTGLPYCVATGKALGPVTN
jgi:hypothetical protein